MTTPPTPREPRPPPRTGLRVGAPRAFGAVAALVALAGAAAGCGPRPAPRDAPLAFPSHQAERAAVAPREVKHVVKPGETLARIAERYYGDPTRWRDLARVNKLRDPDRLVVGEALRVPLTAQEWERAQRLEAALGPYNRGVEAMAEDRLEEAEARFGDAVATAPELFAASYNLALVWMKRGSYDRAEAALRRLTAEYPDDPDVRFAHGSCLFHQARFAEAAAQFRRVLDRDAKHAQAAFSLARALQEGGRRAEAIDAWQRYLRLDAASVWAEEARRALARLRGGQR